ALPLGQLQQVLLVTRRLLLRLPRQLLVARPERRQVQLLQTLQQRHTLLRPRLRHQPPPCSLVGRRTTPGPPYPPTPIPPTPSCHCWPSPPRPPRRSAP